MRKLTGRTQGSRSAFQTSSATLIFMKLLRTVLSTVLITIEAVFAVVILGALVSEADITG